jgi:hypothetical protein
MRLNNCLTWPEILDIEDSFLRHKSLRTLAIIAIAMRERLLNLISEGQMNLAHIFLVKSTLDFMPNLETTF